MTRSAYNAWFHEIIAFYRRLEFFVEDPFRRLTEDQCRQLIESRFPNWHYERFQIASSSDDTSALCSLEADIVAEDQSRVWKAGAERVYEATGFYRDALPVLGRISRKMFHPVSVREHWLRFTHRDIERIIIHVSFEAFDLTRHFWISRDSDFANPGFVAAVNQVVQRTGQVFRMFGDDSDWFVVSQTDAEVAAMQQRGFSFHDVKDVSGLLQHPDAGLIKEAQACDRWLYAQRGLFRYNVGDSDDAWEDLQLATRFGVPDLYTAISELQSRDSPRKAN